MDREREREKERERERERERAPMPLLLPLFPSLMAGAAASRECTLPLRNGERERGRKSKRDEASRGRVSGGEGERVRTGGRERERAGVQLKQ
jgi:hypothetical protein